MNTVKIESVSQVHEMLGIEPPAHPLISLVENSESEPLAPKVPVMNIKFTTELYTIGLKQGNECQIRYGRQKYDFQEGSMMFLAPGQAITPVKDQGDLETYGESWNLMFHPELIRRFPLASKMGEFTYFMYDSNEALHLSQRERQTVSDIARRIREEYSQNIDVHSPELILSNLELLLNYCKRFYGRQFVTRTSANRDVVIRFEALLKEYFESGRAAKEGLPSVQLFAKEIGYSPNYLSDLLRKETGRNTRDHIHHALIERAKNLLMGTEDTVAEIAYSLGFEYPQHFSKLFKNVTGIPPAEYRTPLD